LGAALGDEASVSADRSAPLHWAELPGYESTAPLPQGPSHWPAMSPPRRRWLGG